LEFKQGRFHIVFTRTYKRPNQAPPRFSSRSSFHLATTCDRPPVRPR
jgi:hypothetical protein